VIVALWMTTTLRHLITPRDYASGQPVVS